MKFLQALRNAAQRLAADFEDSKLFDHRGEKGEFREYIAGQFLRSFLPRCYGIGSGQVFAEDGNSSNQIDLVLYDTVFSNVLFREANSCLFPCESVYGTVEVKTNLSTPELETAVANVASVKRLDRASSDMCDMLPFRRFNVGTGLVYDRQIRNPYLGIVFAYEGLSSDTVVAKLNRYLQTRDFPVEHLPDFVFCYRRGYVVAKFRSEEQRLVPAPPGSSFERYEAISTGNDTLPLFFLTLNVCLNQIILKTPDFNNYWVQVVSQAIESNTGCQNHTE